MSDLARDLSDALSRHAQFRWETPQSIGNGEVACHMEATGFGIIAGPDGYGFGNIRYTVVHSSDGQEVDCDSSYNNAMDAIRRAESE